MNTYNQIETIDKEEPSNLNILFRFCLLFLCILVVLAFIVCMALFIVYFKL